MTSEEAVLLIAAHMEHPAHSAIPRAELPDQFPQFPPEGQRPYPAEPLPHSMERSQGDWFFEDQNVATHLIRNTLGGAGSDRDVKRKVLSMRGATRKMRDDVTSM